MAMAEEICRRLRMSNEDTEQIVALVANHMRFVDVERMKDSTFKRFVRMDGFDQHLELHRRRIVGPGDRLDRRLPRR